jgi:hypothetical protein
MNAKYKGTGPVDIGAWTAPMKSRRKGYAIGGPIEVTGHWGPKSISSSGSSEESTGSSSDMASSSNIGMLTGTGLPGGTGLLTPGQINLTGSSIGTGISSGSSSNKKTKKSGGTKTTNW